MIEKRGDRFYSDDKFKEEKTTQYIADFLQRKRC